MYNTQAHRFADGSNGDSFLLHTSAMSVFGSLSLQTDNGIDYRKSVTRGQLMFGMLLRDRCLSWKRSPSPGSLLACCEALN